MRHNVILNSCSALIWLHYKGELEQVTAAVLPLNPRQSLLWVKGEGAVRWRASPIREDLKGDCEYPEIVGYL